MKKALLLGAALVSMASAAQAADLVVEAAPTMATAEASTLSGYVEVSGLATDFDGYDFKGFGVAGALAYSLSADLQVEAELRYQSASSGDSDYSGLDSTVAALHLNYSGDGFSVGAFGGVSGMNDYYDEAMGYSAFGGVEAQVSLLDSVVLGAQVGLSRQLSGAYFDADPADFAFAEANVKYFPLDNLKLQASVGMAKGDMWEEDGLSLLSAGVEAEYQFEGTPVSIFGSYTYTAENYYDYDYLDHAIAKVGARFSFEGKSLKEQATTGASHKVYDFTSVAAIRWW
jgi:hypothetical protein